MVMDRNVSFCQRCYHYWKRRRKKLPKICPKCKSPYWNKPRKKSSKEVVQLLVKEIIRTHDNIIKFSGGLEGTREEGGIYNSTLKIINYKLTHKEDPVGLGALILNEFAKRHYFNDGNKRTAYTLSKIFMMIGRCHLFTNYSDSIDFILEVAKKDSKIEPIEIKKWLRSRCKMIKIKYAETYLKDILYNLIIEVKDNERTN